MTDIIAWHSDDLLLLDKPAGLPVFPPHDDPTGDCVLARLLACRPDQAHHGWPAGFEGGIAHRLDNATSGAVLVARHPDALGPLRARFRDGALAKRYSLVTAREVPWSRHHVTTPLAHHARRRDRMIVQRGAATEHRGRWYPADTELRRQGPLAVPGWTRWEAVIRTGVTHQIRAHAAWVGLPLVGDRIYGGEEIPSEILPSRPPGADFLLHHHGVGGLGVPVPEIDVPGWWPADLSPARR